MHQPGRHGECGAEREPVTGSRRRNPQRSPGTEPLIRGLGGKDTWSRKHFSCWTHDRL